MQKIKKILAPTDMSELSSVGVRYALEMAKELTAEVIVYYAVPLSEDWFSGHEKHGPVRSLLADEEAALDKFLVEKFADESSMWRFARKLNLGFLIRASWQWPRQRQPTLS